jgi:GNAT superfamily N-acetyltransferase
MDVREARAAGTRCIALATELLHRVRLADPTAGVWEAADLQWWWRKPRMSDVFQQLFWLDDDGPVAAVVLTDWGPRWSCDPIVVPHSTPTITDVWSRALELIESLQAANVEVHVRDDDAELITLLTAAGFVVPREQSGDTWMMAADRPAVAALPDGLRVVDRSQSAGRPHPMRHRNGDEVEERLQQCSLYDPELDLGVDAANGDVAAYALFWNDPVTGVGLVEPMRTEDAYQRRGIARILLAAGLDRLAMRGAQRLKVGYSTEAAKSLYISSGFRVGATTTSYERAER